MAISGGLRQAQATEPVEVRAAHERLKFTDGIYLVEFLPLTDPAFMAQSILLALGVEGNPERPALAMLRSRGVMDNKF